MPKVKNVIAALPEPESIDIEALRQAIAKGDVDLVCVLGPTASGKTKYAVWLSGALGGCEILSADSRQVYRGMDIGTGKDLGEYGGVPYHLIDIAEPGTQYNVHRFQEDFQAAIADIRSRGAFPILCGGTGLYISAVTGGYDFQDRKPLSAPRGTCPGTIARTYFIGTLVSREERNARIDRRLAARLQEGLVAEVQGLLDSGLTPESLLYYGLEYKFVTLYLPGALRYDEMVTQLQTAIHQFAKRQMTWFRGMERKGINIEWITLS